MNFGNQLRFTEENRPGATPIDADEAGGLILSISTRAELDEFEAINISRARTWALRSRTVKNGLLEIQTMQLIHRRMFDQTWNWAGRFRQSQKSIGIEAFRIQSELKMLMDDAKVWLEYGSYPPDELAARLHHRLVWIHPFNNGNGRHARPVTDLLVAQQNWPGLTWGAAQLTAQGQAREAYIQSLRAADNRDFAALIEFLRA